MADRCTGRPCESANITPVDLRPPVESPPEIAAEAATSRSAAVGVPVWASGVDLTEGVGWRHSLDAIPNLTHWTYKIPGLLVWALLLSTLITMADAPDMALVGIRLLGLYVVFRVLVTFAFYPVGLVRCAWHGRRQPVVSDCATTANWSRIHHVVLVPNHREPVEILRRTLDALAAQDAATSRLTVVLAMEGAEAEAEAKAAQLAVQYAGCFAHFLVTYHPPDLPGEIPGKGCNQRWAAQQARQYLVDQCDMTLEDLTLTSCDADSRLHPDYFQAITQRFAVDPNRHARIWQSPLAFDNNLWHVPAPIRVLTQFASILNLSELANPFVLKLTQSTYTLSFRLAASIEYWDRRVLAEDSHILLRAFFATHGRVSVQPVFLPTHGDAVTGGTLGEALGNFYRQRRRHAWGSQSAGYILQQWNRHPEIAFGHKLLYLLQVLQDFGLFATATFILAAGLLLDVMTTGSPMVSFFKLAIPAFFFEAMNGAGMVGTALIWATEHARSAAKSGGWRFTMTLADLFVILLMPIFSLLLAVLPVIHANTQLLLGFQLPFLRTQKQGVVALPQGIRRSPPGD